MNTQKTHTVVLEDMPSLSRLYISALGSAARKRHPGTSGPVQLPTAEHVVAGHRVDAGQLTRFQHLLGQSARDTLPSGFIHAAAFPVGMSVMTREDFPLPLPGMIHLRNHVTQYRPVHFAEPLHVSAGAENLRGHHLGTSVDLVVRVQVDGHDVWRGRSTYLAKGLFLPFLDAVRRESEPEPFTPPSRTAVWRLGSEAGRDYAAVSGDFNPIHLSRVSARALGLKRSIAHGMYLASRAVGDVEGDVTGPFSWDVEFRSPVFLPAEVSLGIDDSRVEDRWTGTRIVAWNQRSLRRYFSALIQPESSTSG